MSHSITVIVEGIKNVLNIPVGITVHVVYHTDGGDEDAHINAEGSGFEP